jgi:hypothetical protein
MTIGLEKQSRNTRELKSKNKHLVQDLWLKMYENTLHLFLKNPKDKKALFG